MAKRKTVAELEEKIRQLEPYAEAYYCLRHLLSTHIRFQTDRFASGEDDRYASLGVIGLDRAAGGVVIEINGDPCAPQYLSDVAPRFLATGDPYRCEVVSKAQKAQVQAIDARMRRTSTVTKSKP
jgi:hypothetical protein